MTNNYKVQGWFGSVTWNWTINLEPKFFEDIEEARLYAQGLLLANEESHTEAYEVDVFRVLERGPALKVLTYSAKVH